MLHGDLQHPQETLTQARTWLGEHTVVASLMGNNAHSLTVTDFWLRPCGFERMLVIGPPGTSETRAGRIAARLFELETYRLMALRALPVVKELAPLLARSERQLADITAQLENKGASDQALLDTLVSLAGGVERATAENVYRFAATRAYDTLVSQRTAELREQPIPGTQTLGEFMQRRLSPAMATVAATAQRLAALSDRITRTSALVCCSCRRSAISHCLAAIRKLKPVFIGARGGRSWACGHRVPLRVYPAIVHRRTLAAC